MQCKIQNCTRKIRAKNLCSTHYNSSLYYKNKEKFLSYDRTPNRRYKKFIAHCKREQIPTDITFKQWQKIIEPNKCYYCFGILPIAGSGLDRKYPNMGYFKDNVVPCCGICNKTKSNVYSHIEFTVMMNALIKFRKQYAH